MGDKLGDKLGQGLRKVDTPSNTGKQEGRQWETRPREGGHTIQHRHTCEETVLDNGKQWETMGENALKRETTPRHPTHVGRQWETRGGKTSEGGHSIQHRHTCGETMGDKTSKRRTHHPTQAHMRRDKGETTGDNGRQGETRGDKASGRRTHHPTKGNKTGDNGRQGGNKTSGRWTHHPT